MTAHAVKRDNLNCMRPVGGEKDNPVLKVLEQLFESGIVAREDWDALEPRTRLELKGHHNLDRFLMRLVDHRLLTAYQSARLQSGQKNGLTLGRYRLLDRLGAGTSSVVFKGQHIETRQEVALKVLIPGQQDDQLLVRFDTERRSIAQLQHPNIVRLLDVGEATSKDPDAPLLYYYAMEFIPGTDLEAQVKQHGRLSIEQACQLAFQMASALNCAHQQGLVHRDIKPSNILWSTDGVSKLLDFGLARHHLNRLTQPGMVLGALEFIAPEQALDGSAVDIRADLFALGSTLYFCLTGQAPFSIRGNLLEVIQNRATTPAPSVSFLNPQVPERLDILLGRLMALKPGDRFQTPHELMIALEEFVGPQANLEGTPLLEAADAPRVGARILIVSAQPELPAELDEATETLDLLCQHIEDVEALGVALFKFDPDIVLLDVNLPLPALELAKMVHSPNRFLKIILMAHGPLSGASASLASGIDDLFTFPQEPIALQVRLRSLLQLQEAQRRMASLNPQPAPLPQEDAAAVPQPRKKSGLMNWLWGKK